MAADEKSTLTLFFDCRFHTLHILTLSGIACVTILKYTLILSPQFTKGTENKTSNQKEN
jgi:hypothetical protein